MAPQALELNAQTYRKLSFSREDFYKSKTLQTHANRASE